MQMHRLLHRAPAVTSAQIAQTLAHGIDFGTTCTDFCTPKLIVIITKKGIVLEGHGHAWVIGDRRIGGMSDEGPPPKKKKELTQGTNT